MLRHFVTTAWFCLVLAIPICGQVVINEFMTSNGSTHRDEDDSYEDWIELYNTGAEAIDLAEWGLSDSNSNPFKWRFPENSTIAPGGHLLVWASGKDRVAGQDIPGIVRELWHEMPGGTVESLTSHPMYAFAPSLRAVHTDLFEAPTNWRDNYGQRMRGVVIAPATGAYRFWIAADDTAELHLSTDENPENTTVIASVTAWTSSRQWTKYASQQSDVIHLVEGGRYFIEALMKESVGGDNLAVRWQLPDGSFEAPMSARHLVHARRTGHHTNFRISGSGEPLRLTRPDGTTADHLPAVMVPRDVSYGRLTDGAASWHFFADPTPGESNTTATRRTKLLADSACAAIGRAPAAW